LTAIPEFGRSATSSVDFKAPWFEITDSLGQFGTKPKPS